MLFAMTQNIGPVATACFPVRDECLEKFKRSLFEQSGLNFTTFEALGAYIWRSKLDLRISPRKIKRGFWVGSSSDCVASCKESAWKCGAMFLLAIFNSKLGEEGWLQGFEKPTLHPAISAQLQGKFEVSDEDVGNWKSVRNEMRIAVNSLLKSILVIPTVTDFPPKLGGKEILSEDYRSRLFSLLSIASISGCCHAAIFLWILLLFIFDVYFLMPCIFSLSVSLIARHGGDRFLLDIVQGMYTTLQAHAEIAAKPKSSRNVVSEERSAEIAKEKVLPS
ncbi:hypothetical protein K1719_008726 [Acacia pycnantha]|nr:hypothetical protein K1719_008726 [Acacia pycnantha]